MVQIHSPLLPFFSLLFWFHISSRFIFIGCFQKFTVYQHSLKRLWEIDFLRGTAVILMIVFHILYDINFLNIYHFELYTSWLILLPYTIGTMFLLLVGLSLTLSYSRAVKSLIKSRLPVKYIRRGLSNLSSYPKPKIRRIAAMLAGRLENDETLKTLLGDREPEVVAMAALAAGLSRRTALVGTLAQLLQDSEDIEIVSSAAYVLALLDPQKYSTAICKTILETNDEQLCDRLLHVATLLGDTK